MYKEKLKYKYVNYKSGGYNVKYIFTDASSSNVGNELYNINGLNDILINSYSNYEFKVELHKNGEIPMFFVPTISSYDLDSKNGNYVGYLSQLL
jgi:hypothetical protein